MDLTEIAGYDFFDREGEREVHYGSNRVITKEVYKKAFPDANGFDVATHGRRLTLSSRAGTGASYQTFKEDATIFKFVVNGHRFAREARFWASETVHITNHNSSEQLYDRHYEIEIIKPSKPIRSFAFGVSIGNVIGNVFAMATSGFCGLFTTMLNNISNYFEKYPKIQLLVMCVLVPVALVNLILAAVASVVRWVLEGSIGLSTMIVASPIIGCINLYNYCCSSNDDSGEL